MGISNNMKEKLKKLPKPIIMPKNPARIHMPHALAVKDDQMARDKQGKLAAYEKKLEAENKVKLQEEADAMDPVKEDANEKVPEATKEDGSGEQKGPVVPEEPVAKPVANKAVKKKANPFEKKKS